MAISLLFLAGAAFGLPGKFELAISSVHNNTKSEKKKNPINQEYELKNN